MGRDYLPAVLMWLVQLGFAGMNVVSKLALDTGMSPYVLIAYRNIIAGLFLSPFAFFLERKSRELITKKVLLQIFFSSIFGATLNQVLYFVGLKSTTPTVACALGNTLPALTFIIAALLKVESVRITTLPGLAKVLGTVVCVGGSMIMPFYRGPLIKFVSSPFHWRYAEHTTDAAAPASGNAAVVGDILIILSCLAWAVWFILHNKMAERFSAPYTSTSIMSLMAGVQCVGVSAAVDRSLLVWKLGFDIRLYSVVYIGVVGSGIAFAVMAWCIKLRGPLFVSVFSPVMLVAVAVVGWAILEEKIYLGTLIGSTLIVAGLYTVLWGKGREIISPAVLDGDDTSETTAATMDVEMNRKEAMNGSAAILPVFCTTPNTALPPVTTPTDRY